MLCSPASSCHTSYKLLLLHLDLSPHSSAPQHIFPAFSGQMSCPAEETDSMDVVCSEMGSNCRWTLWDEW